ncbi:class II glutamine amidotransferase [Streptomyces sp. NPDC005573]|uniref:class II glutamine amidotransferase n=1 Tax=Streptomyces sp. NPDC005573 TaxID=3156890 RepID=UPI0033BAB9DA
MCRMMGVVARQPRPLRELFADDLAPFLAMACEHDQGWGVASLTRQGVVSSVKRPERADGSTGLPAELDDRTTTAGLLHLRMASRQFAVVPENTHPFGDERMAFVHNGDFSPADCVDGLIGASLLDSAEGCTDSERYYLAIRRRIDDGVAPPKAIAVTAADIRARAAGFVSLNCMLLTAEAVYAHVAHDPHSEVIRRRGPGYFSLNYREDADKVLIASAGWPQEAPAWSPLPEGAVLEISLGDLSVTVHEG